MRLVSHVFACLLFPACAAAVLTPAPTAPAQLLAYHLNPGETLRYKLTGKIHASLPLGADMPADLNADINVVYAAKSTTRLSDGTMDVDFKVESAELTVEKIPFPLELKQAQEILNQSITLTKTGEVKKTRSGAPLPFGVSVPGVDPKRLYALIFPIVFQSKPVREGDSWSFKSELLGGEGTAPSFTATVLRSGDSGAAGGGAKPASLNTKAAPANMVRLREDFQMAVDQKVNVDNKPPRDENDVHRVRQGKIEGDGVFQFDRAKGRFNHGTVNIRANVKDTLVGEPASEDEPKELVTKVDAKVTVELLPAQTGGKRTPRKEDKP